MCKNRSRTIPAKFYIRNTISLLLFCASLAWAAGCTSSTKVTTPPSPPTDPPPPPPAAEWSMAGQNLGDTRDQPAETTISNTNVSSLVVKWSYTTAGSVSATPAVANSAVYFPDWAGNLYALDASSGQQLWSTTISSYTGIPNDVSRTTPAVYNNELILGDNLADSGPHNGAWLIAVNSSNGQLLWMTQIDTHPAAIVTGSAVVYNGIVYQGVSSAEEQYATMASYQCCTFRGSMVAVNASTGQLLWKTYVAPDNGGAANQYSGNAIWSPPVIDSAHGLLYIGTGNNYTVPASVSQCQQANPNATNCAEPADYFDSVVAMDLTTGALAWEQRLQNYDVWTVACVSQNPGNPCPSPAGEDNDFGSGGNLFGSTVGIGHKSGMYWMLNTSDGSVAWGSLVGPHGSLGGIIWGSATDGTRIYATLTNNEHFNYTLANGQTITGSAWNAIDPATGKILWQTVDPAQGTSFNMSAVSVANGVMYSGDMDGHMYALDAATGKILWNYQATGTVLDGPAIANGVVYWGAGYPRSGGTPGNTVYAFALPGSN
jgi:polyvinyl alcohol dehydrogenase (cytochrome)